MVAYKSRVPFGSAQKKCGLKTESTKKKKTSILRELNQFSKTLLLKGEQAVLSVFVAMTVTATFFYCILCSLYIYRYNNF